MSKDNYPNITVDAVVFSYINEKLCVLLIKRNYEPFKDQYSLPGAFVREDEDSDKAVRRMLVDETGLAINYIEQLYTFTEPNRDPRQRIISISYYALINSLNEKLTTSKHASVVEWVDIKEALLKRIAFDHETILYYGLKRLRNKVKYEPIGFDLLPKYFTMSELYKLYSVILSADIDRRNFTRKILGFGLLKETKYKTTGHVGRQAKMYEFDNVIYTKLQKEGFNFEL